MKTLSYVHDGRECIGFILSRGCVGAEAFTADERSVGLFKDDQDAARELWRRARGQTSKLAVDEFRELRDETVAERAARGAEGSRP